MSELMKTLSRPQLIACLLAVLVSLLCSLAGSLRQTEPLPDAGIDYSARFAAIPDLTTVSGVTAPVGSHSLWRLNAAVDVAPQPILNAVAVSTQQFQMRKQDGRQMVCNRQQPEVCWDFYGVAREGKDLRALFYNSANSETPWQRLAAGEELEAGLRLEKIARDQVALSFSDDEQQLQQLSLKVFSVDVDDFVRKDESQ